MSVDARKNDNIHTNNNGNVINDKNKSAPFPVLKDVSSSKVVGGWLKHQLGLLHVSSEERSIKTLSFGEFRRRHAAAASKETDTSLFLSQDFGNPNNLFPRFGTRTARRESDSKKVGFGSSTPTGRVPRVSSKPKRRTNGLEKEESDYWRVNDFEDHAWESWDGMTTRQIRNTPMWKAFAAEHPAVFDDLFTPTEEVDEELLDPEKGFEPPTFKLGFGLPGIGFCKDADERETNQNYKKAYETTERLKMLGKLDEFLLAGRRRQRNRGARSWEDDYDEDDADLGVNLSRNPTGRRRRLERPNWMYGMYGFGGNFNHCYNDDIGCTDEPNLMDRLKAIEAFSPAVGFDGNFSHRYNDDIGRTDECTQRNIILAERGGSFGGSAGWRWSQAEHFGCDTTLHGSAHCSQAVLMGVAEDTSVDGEETENKTELMMNQLEQPIPRKSVLKTAKRDMGRTEIEEPSPRGERRARFAEVSQPETSN